MYLSTQPQVEYRHQSRPPPFSNESIYLYSRSPYLTYPQFTDNGLKIAKKYKSPINYYLANTFTLATTYTVTINYTHAHNQLLSISLSIILSDTHTYTRTRNHNTYIHISKPPTAAVCPFNNLNFPEIFKSFKYPQIHPLSVPSITRPIR